MCTDLPFTWKQMKIPIEGFLKEPRVRATGEPYPGRFACEEVQWTITGNDVLSTFTMTAREITDASEGRLLWTDQDVQRGIKPGLPHAVPRELPLADGYPNPAEYIFDVQKADEIAVKLLEGERLFLNPLVWNLRPGKFEAYWNDEARALWIYSGKIYLPDSHHRQQAILKAVRTFDEDPGSYPRFSPGRQLKIELYFLTSEDEGNYFFDKNQRPKPTAKSKAYDLTTVDDLSVLAKRVVERTGALASNVNRVTDRLTRANPQVITLSTLRQMMALVAPGDVLDETEIDGIAETAATFYDLLADVRPELGRLPVAERRVVRDTSLIDSAVMMYGYAYLMADFREDIPETGIERAANRWRQRLSRLTHKYRFCKWKGDLFSRENPLWQTVGVLKPRANSERLTLSNTGATRAECGRILRGVVESESPHRDLTILARK